MIDFQHIELARKAEYQQYFSADAQRGCEYSFGNLYMWGKQNIAVLHGCIGFFSHFQGRSVYPYPIGPGDKKAVIEAYLHDARCRGIPCRITGILPEEQTQMESWFPGRFQFRCDRDSFDYVYSIDDLADLRGRKYQKKRNHFNRFQVFHPDYRILPLTREEIPMAAQMIASWYSYREARWPQSHFLMEKRAIRRCLKELQALQVEGCLLLDGDDVLAVTMATRLSGDTFDVHFEKAREDVDGAYTAINCEFARYLRLKYPEIRFLNREDDLGLEGLRKAKLSYLPHHMIEKSWAYLTEDIYED